jgi:TonB family protein
MSHTHPRGTLLDVPLIEERYGPSFCIAVALHVLLAAGLLVAPLVMPGRQIVQLGTGPGGGQGGTSYTVGVTDDPGGGAGLVKPATTPQPAVLPVEKAAKKEPPSKAVAIPDSTSTKAKKRAEIAGKTDQKAPAPTTGPIPVSEAKGAGGAGAAGAGSGGGIGTGVGISIGSGAGGVGDSLYARTVESRVGSNWRKPEVQQRVEIICTFMVGDDGRIYDPKLVKSSGNDALDLMALRAIQQSNPLTMPPPELRGKLLQFTARFVYPPD